ncbi:MAG TPA: iron-sulfur cluster assembly scaffold protein [Rhizomicrobium sp.]|nr:iron-sulfur cluster assembly scaffold protein [Rhizomicrobium sp.]
MNDPLYKKSLLRLAADAAGAGRLEEPHATGTVRNPACGDCVTVDLALEDERITGIAFETKACVLVQASASILGADAMGLNRGEIESLRGAVVKMLTCDGDPPPAPFNTYHHFDGVCGHKSRHQCVLLPLDAVLAAFDQVK